MKQVFYLLYNHVSADVAWVGEYAAEKELLVRLQEMIDREEFEVDDPDDWILMATYSKQVSVSRIINLKENITAK